MTTSNGGPAFPCEMLGIDEHGEYRKPYEGMTLRDYFAAKAMQVIMKANADADTDAVLAAVGKSAYAFADAMLKAREV